MSDIDLTSLYDTKPPVISHTGGFFIHFLLRSIAVKQTGLLTRSIHGLYRRKGGKATRYSCYKNQRQKHAAQKHSIGFNCCIHLEIPFYAHSPAAPAARFGSTLKRCV
jgi:hypothetical protein